jgi:hypothetical protein
LDLTAAKTGAIRDVPTLVAIQASELVKHHVTKPEGIGPRVKGAMRLRGAVLRYSGAVGHVPPCDPQGLRTKRCVQRS